MSKQPATLFDPARPGRFEMWRRRTLHNAHSYPLALQPILRWTLASHVDPTVHETYVKTMNAEKWWVTHDVDVKHRLIILLVYFSLLSFLYYAGFIHFVIYKVVSVLLPSKIAVMSSCNHLIAKNVPLLRRADLTAYRSDEWVAANPRPFANLTERDYTRGYAHLSVGWLGGEIVPIHLKEVEDVLLARSAAKHCVCAAHFGIPLASFAFDGRMFWDAHEWLVPPSGANRTCAGFPAIVTMEHAKVAVRTRLCDARKKASVALHLSKAELCCLDYCKNVA